MLLIEIALLLIFIFCIVPFIADTFEWLASVFSANTSTCMAYSCQSAIYGTNNNAIAMATVFAALVTLFLGWPIAYSIARRKSRREYEYKRSEYVTRNIFKKEFSDICDMARELHRLIYATKTINPNRNKNENLTECSCQYYESKQRVEDLLSSAALSLFYTDEYGCAYCGVDTNKNSENYKPLCSRLFPFASAQLPESLNAIAKVPNKNLYVRAIEIYLLCVCIVEKNLDLDYQPLGEKRCSAALGCDVRNQLDYLDCRYSRFLNCAKCRIRAIEMGTKDTQRRNFFDSMPFHILVSFFAQWFNNECVFDKQGNSDIAFKDVFFPMTESRNINKELRKSNDEGFGAEAIGATTEENAEEVKEESE